MQNYLMTACMAAALLLANCATPPPSKPLSTEQRILQDNTLGLRLAQEFEPSLNFRNDIELSVYLRRVAKTLSDATPALKSSPVGVFMIKDRDTRWKSYALPGNRVYLSAGLLKKMDYENELAAAIAFQLGHIIKRSALNRYREMTTNEPVVTSYGESGRPPQGAIQFFGPAGLFAFSEEDQFEAADSAIEILYHAGFDSRGLVSLWMKYQNNPERSPFEPSTLTRLLERTRQAIAMYTPLRNPVVRSKAFLAIQQRIRKL